MIFLLLQLFEDWSEKAGIRGEEAPTVAFADLDGDGRPEIVLNRTKIAGRGRVPFDGTPQAVQFGDVDDDGDLDLFFCTMSDPEKDEGKRNELWINDGGFKRKLRWEDRTLTATAAFLDYDRDGKLDLFEGNWYARPWKSQEAQASRLWRGRDDGTFEDVTEKAKILGIAEPGKRESRKPVFGVTHTDWNNDGWQDILVQVYGRQWNLLWRNNGDGTFTDVAGETGYDGDADRSGKYSDEVKKLFKEKRNVDLEDEPEWRANGNTFDCAVADFDNDGDMDCFLGEIAHWWAGPSSDRSMLLVNEGLKFRRDPKAIDRPLPGKNWNEGDLHAGWLDVENDGLLDLVIASSDYPDEQILKLYRQKPDHTFEDWTEKLGFRWVSASQISLGDYDRDGATDILVGRNHMRLDAEQQKKYPLSAGLFRNVAAAKAGNGFFNLRLRGQAVGARVTITVAGVRQIREVYGGLGHAGHRDDTDCRFGVGKAKRVDRVEVRWPDASVQTFEDVEANRFYSLTKGKRLDIAGR